MQVSSTKLTWIFCRTAWVVLIIAPKNGVWMLSAMISKVFVAIVKPVTTFANRFWVMIDVGILSAVTLWSAGLYMLICGFPVSHQPARNATPTWQFTPCSRWISLDWYHSIENDMCHFLLSVPLKFSRIFDWLIARQDLQSTPPLTHFRLPAISDSAPRIRP
jgi:hypothetical protein